jgi:hypothetical protein
MVSVEEFLERICRLGGERPRPLPRRRRDREILVKSILMRLDSSRSYSEPEINELIEIWNREVVPAIQTDYVTVRRLLIDQGHLERTADGRAYRVGFRADAVAFDLEIDDIDLAATVAAYRARPKKKRPPQSAG